MTAPPAPPVPPKAPPKTDSRERVSGTGTSGTSDTPPRRRAAGPGTEGQRAGASSPKRPGPAPKLLKSLEELFSAPALAYSLAGDQWAAEFVATHAPALAESWYKLAQENLAVKRVLERITTGTAWGGVIVTTGATVLPLLAHHRLLPGPAQAVFTAADDPAAGPIVPPPPRPDPSSPRTGQSQGPRSPRQNGARGRDDMTAPVKPGEPPGVVTVAGSNNNATG